MAVDPQQQGIIRGGQGTPADRGDFTAWQRDQAAADMARRAADQADAAELDRREDYLAGQQVVNYTEEPLSEEEWQSNRPVIGEVAPPQPVVPAGVIDVSTPELADQVKTLGATGQRLGAVPSVPERTVSGPRIVTIVGPDLMGFVLGENEYDFLSGRQYKVPGFVADHLVRKRAAI